LIKNKTLKRDNSLFKVFFSGFSIIDTFSKHIVNSPKLPAPNQKIKTNNQK